MNCNCPELVFALVGPMGTDLEQVQSALKDSLDTVGYTSVDIRLTDLLREVYPKLPTRASRGYYKKAIKAGNKIRKKLGRGDAMAALAVSAIRRHREKNESAEEKDERRAYILSSLKRPEEVELLRDVYGASLFVVSAYAPRQARVNRVASRLAEQEFRNRIEDHRGNAEQLVRTDESESSDFGQDIRKTYPLADFFVNTNQSAECMSATQRFITLIFGHPWHTPTRDEQHMAMAYLASLRSASPARQVGAALIGQSGDLLSVGCNEVAKTGGGQYWEGDLDDHRDNVFDSLDTSDKMRRNLLSELLHTLQSDLHLFKKKFKDVDSLLEIHSESYKKLRTSQLFDTIDFIRAVHAEASALFSASGPTTGSTLYVTTFPCHECARHIVFCGVSRVVYVEPYPKSLVSEMYSDSIAVDSEDQNGARVQFTPFTGISPTVYQHLFSLTRKSRKGNDGKLKRWVASTSEPRLHISYSQSASTQIELEVMMVFDKQLKAKGLMK